MSANCGNCIFFVPHVVGARAGHCHRHAPVVMDRAWTHPEHGLQHETITVWPDTVMDKFCGDWKRK